MADLLFMSGAFVVCFFIIACLLGITVLSAVELVIDDIIPTWVKWLIVVFITAFLMMLVGVSLKIMETL